MIEKRAGDRHAFFKANVELSARILRIVWGVLQSGKPYSEGKAFFRSPIGVGGKLKAKETRKRLARMPQEARPRGGTTQRPSRNASLASPACLSENARSQAKKRREVRMAAV